MYRGLANFHQNGSCEGYTDARIRTDGQYIRNEAIGSTLVFISCGRMNLNLDNTSTDSTQHTDESFDRITSDRS